MSKEDSISKLDFSTPISWDERLAAIRDLASSKDDASIAALLVVLLQAKPDDEAIRRMSIVRDRLKGRLEKEQGTRRDHTQSKLQEINEKLRDEELVPTKLIEAAVQVLIGYGDPDIRASLQAIMTNPSYERAHSIIAKALEADASTIVPTPNNNGKDSDLMNSFRWEEMPANEIVLSYIIPGVPQENIRARDIKRHVKISSYKISTHLVTNAQWQQFVDDPDGYSNKRWWEYSAFAPRNRAFMFPGDRRAPRYDEKPCVSVNYHDALAFCFWLSDKLGMAVTLPSEPEWMSAKGYIELDDIYEWTITDMADDGRRNTSMIQPTVRRVIIKRNGRTGSMMQTRKSSIGFRVAVSDRKLQRVQLTHSLSYYLDLIGTKPTSMGPSESAVCVGILRDQQSVEPLLNKLASERSDDRIDAIFALYWMADSVKIPARPIVDFLFQTQAPRVNDYARLVLIETGGIQELIASVEDEDDRIRLDTLNILCALYTDEGIADERIVDVMLSALEDEHELVVARAVEFLANIGEAQAVEPIKALATDTRNPVVKQVQIAMQRWG